MTPNDSVFDLPPVATSVGRARSLVLTFIRDSKLSPAFSDDGELLVSELVTNAIRHGAAPIRLTLHAGAGSLSVHVHDSGSGMPAIRETNIELAGGRGLRLVEQLASAWGVDLEPEGKTVWFRLDTSAEASADPTDEQWR